MAKFDVNEDLVRKLAGLLEETGLSEIEYEAEDRRIRVSKGAAPAPVQAASAAPPASAGETAPPPSAAGDIADVLPPGAVTSPMVGTVYVASEPGSPPFVKVGDSVQEGQTLLIIEAMKVMNPLASPRGGKVTQILISDGEPVEFGEPLLVIE
jgi:acetyl-CoA carboxylase biotin carboxyl carrier protein